jgi:hypothetical protein
MPSAAREVRITRTSLSESRELLRLRQAHRLALERFVDVASATCGRMARLTPETISEIDRANLLVGTRKETLAHENYLAAKAALLEYLSTAGR